MGMDNNMYAGIYIKYKPQKEEVKKDVYKCLNCGNQSEEYHEEFPFCSRCGTEIKKITETTLQDKSYWEELETELDEDLTLINDCNECLNTYILNFTSKYSNHLEESEDNILDFSDILNLKDKIENFIISYPKIIEFLKKYHKDNYKICYGFINYWY